jgi:HEAT repeat protein
MRSTTRYASTRGLLVAIFVSLPLAGVPAGHAAPDTPLSTAGPILEEYGAKLQDQSRPEVERMQFIGLLGLWQGDQVRPPLVAVLNDPLDGIRVAAARALGWKGNREAVPALRARLEVADEKPAVRIAVLEALGRIGDESAREALISATRDGDPAIRGAALWGLTFENLTSPADRVPLLRQMVADRRLDPYMRCQAIEALGTLRDVASAELFMRVIEQEPSSPMPPLSNAPGEREVLALRYRQTRDVKAWAVKALWAMNVRAAIPLMMKAAEDRDDFFLRLTALESLGSWRVYEALPVFVRQLDDPFEPIRITALWSLQDLGDRSVVSPVLNRLADKDSGVRAQAVETLGELGDRRVRTELEALQKSEPDPRVQDALEKAIERLPR